MPNDEYYRRLVQSSSSIPWELDLATWTFTWVGPQAELALGYPVSDWLKPNFWLEHLHPDDRQWAPEFCRTAVGRKEDHIFEYRMRAADGRWVWLRDEVSVVTDSGEPGRLQGFLIDITDQKLVSESLSALARSPSGVADDELFRGMVRSVATVYGARYAFLGEVQPGGRRVRTLAVWAGDRFADDFEYELRGTPCDDVLDQTLEIIPKDAAKLYPDDEMLVEMGVESYFGAPLVSSERRTIGILSVMDVRPMQPSTSTRPVLGVFAARGAVELQRRQEAQAAREQRAQLITELIHARKMESVGRLAGGVAHDFNNLLTVVLGNCDEILSRAAPTDPLVVSVSEIQQAGQRARALTEQLLAFSRRQVLAPKLLSIETVIEGVRSMLTRLLGAQVEVAFNIEPDLGILRADPNQLEQVIVNLAINARDAMPDGGTLEISAAEVKVPAPPSPDARRFLQLTVADTGEGMDEETMARVFEPFFTTKVQGRGTGLGLATAYGVIEQSGGRISVSSTPGNGTTFTILLPMVEGPLASANDPQPTSPSKGTTEKTVLVVEDDRLVRRFVTRAMTAQGYRVLEASSLEDAVRVTGDRLNEVDILLTDVVLPGCNGFKLADTLQESNPDMRVLFMSGYPAESALPGNELKPGVHFIAKPFSTPELATKVREVLRLSSPPCAGVRQVRS